MSSLEADISFDEFTTSFSYAPVMQHCTPSPPCTTWTIPLMLPCSSTRSLKISISTLLPGSTLPATLAHPRVPPSTLLARLSTPPESVCPGLTTPPRAGSPVRNHGPLLLPKIRSQDQDLDGFPPATAGMMSTPPPAPVARRSKAFRHARSYTNPETLNAMVMPHFSFPTPPREDGFSNQLLCSPANFAHSHDPSKAHTRRCSSVEAITADKYAYPSYRTVPVMQQTDFTFPSATYTPRAPSPLTMAASVNVTPEPTPTTTLLSFLTGANSAASLVRTVSFPHRDPNIKHFWWDIRNIRTWSSFNLASVLTLPGASLLNTPIPAPVLPQPTMSSRHPETEAALHSIYASYYLPKLNSALALCSERPLQLSVPAATKAPAPSTTSSSPPTSLARPPPPPPCSAASPPPASSASSAPLTASTRACVPRATSSASSTSAASPPSTTPCASTAAATASSSPRSSSSSSATAPSLPLSSASSRSRASSSRPPATSSSPS
uniref:Uncharacterized protein n=1 Tax=Bionectria ochroleuca TaxID=29856 RepID=A0A8H7N6Z9_BIOOC